MRNLALIPLAGLLAVTLLAFPTASALCADDGNGGCQSMGASSVAFDVRGDCADSAGGLCISDDGNASNILAGSDLHLNVTNHHGVPIDFEVFIIQRMDDPVSDTGEPERLRADRIALLEDIAAGETRYHKFAVDGNTSQLRFQALSTDGKHAELDVQAMHVMFMTGGAPEVDPVQDGLDDGAHDDVDADADASSEDAPFLPFVMLIGLVAAIVAFRRDD